MKHLKEGLIKQRGVAKVIPNMDKIFEEYNICLTGSEISKPEYGVVLLDSNKFNQDFHNVILSYLGSWYVQYYNDNLEHKNNKSGDIQEVWKPDKQAISKIEKDLKERGYVLPEHFEDLIKNHCKLIWKR